MQKHLSVCCCLPVAAVWLGVVGCHRESAPVQPVVNVAAAAPSVVPPPVQVAVAQAGAKTAEENRKEAVAAETVFAAERGGKNLAELLRPGGNNLERARSYQKLQPPLAALKIQAPMPPYQGLPPRAAGLDKNQPVRPRPLREETPLSSQRGQPKPPQALQLPAGELVRRPPVDVSIPPPPPLLAQHLRQRAPLTDPTMAASLAAVLGELQPIRAAPVPFAAINLPDPFEHSQAVRLRQPPPEEVMPVKVK